MAERNRRAAIIDIGSNSVRLVVYAGPDRARQPIFNEKLMAGLGSELATTGRIEQRAFDRAIAALARFKILTKAMAVTDIRCVATAAVRDADNGPEFIRAAAAVGQRVELLSGRDEARASGFGVISAIPDADGIVADLGGGSLELVRVSDGQTRHHSSFPLGVLRFGVLRELHGKRLARYVGQLLTDAGWPGKDANLPLYLVGGSWRALARYEMLLARDPMPVLSGHVMRTDSAATLHRRLRKLGVRELSQLQGLSSARVETMPDAAELLAILAERLRPAHMVLTTSGLREGLLFQDLPDAVRRQDPLIVAAQAEAGRFTRFGLDGAALDAWIDPLFGSQPDQLRRIRLAACHLSDVAMNASPDFRTERAVELGLHGQWLGVTIDERKLLAQALYTSVGGQGQLPETAHGVSTPGSVDGRPSPAIAWGLAIRLAQRLSGGTQAILTRTRLCTRDGMLVLQLPHDGAHLAGEQTVRRLAQLGVALGLKPLVEPMTADGDQPQRKVVTTPS